MNCIKDFLTGRKKCSMRAQNLVTDNVEKLVFQQQERKGETIVGWCCFVNGNREELPDCSVWGEGKNLLTMVFQQ
jgi:hypothetical protein